jgi:glycosyltransferase involved in cell wall biosynthesis
VGDTEFTVSGCGANRSQFVLAALGAAAGRPSLVAALHPHLAPVTSAMRLRSRTFRTIVFAHGIEVWEPLRWPRSAALRRANLVTAPSEDTARHLIADQKVSPAKVRRLPWGLDPEFERRLAAPAPPERPAVFPVGARIILTVGRWDSSERYKGADTLISALPDVLAAVPDVLLVLVGDGDDRPRLQQLAGSCGVALATRFVSGLTQEELFACYAHCDVFALPSRGEGFGLVFLEVMAHGKPVIGGAHGGTPDVVQDGVTGILVRHGDAARLSAALVSLLAHPNCAREMGMRGRERVQAMYTFSQFELRLTSVLEEALAANL